MSKVLKDFLANLSNHTKEAVLPWHVRKGLGGFRKIISGLLWVSKKVAEKLRHQNQRMQTILHWLDQIHPENKSFQNPCFYDPVAFESLVQSSRDLHRLLNQNVIRPMSVTVILVAFRWRIDELNFTLKSVFHQSCPDLEILILTQASLEIQKCIGLAEKRVQVIGMDELQAQNEGEAMQEVVLRRVNKDWILWLQSGDWIRPDFFYRIEQVRCLEDALDSSVLFYVDEFNFDGQGQIFGPGLKKRDPFVFPYLFSDQMRSGYVVSKTQWLSLFPLPESTFDIFIFRAFLRLCQQQKQMVRIPLPLYGRRFHAEGKEEISIKKAASFQTQLHEAGFDWQVMNQQRGFDVRPPFVEGSKVHVLVPFKEAKNITIHCIEHLLAQKSVSVLITAIDNGSSDLSIAEELRKKGVEVLVHSEPFNFSRINNVAVQKSRYQGQSEALLFLNNDVILQPDALYEMVRWVQYKKVGAVGAKLLYPQGLIQHAGLSVDLQSPLEKMQWQHLYYQLSPQKALGADSLSLVEGVTGACMMMRSELFRQLGGFDEKIYPVAFSDTDLCFRIRLNRFLIVYTPRATGIHYESLTRKKHHIEDFERSMSLFLKKHFSSIHLNL